MKFIRSLALSAELSCVDVELSWTWHCSVNFYDILHSSSHHTHVPWSSPVAVETKKKTLWCSSSTMTAGSERSLQSERSCSWNLLRTTNSKRSVCSALFVGSWLLTFGPWSGAKRIIHNAGKQTDDGAPFWACAADDRRKSSMENFIRTPVNMKDRHMRGGGHRTNSHCGLCLLCLFVWRNQQQTKLLVNPRSHPYIHYIGLLSTFTSLYHRPR